VKRPKKALKRRHAGRPAASETDAHKELILDVATQVFLDKGFSAASMAEIAERAGASKGTLYALYPSKMELFIGLFRRRLAARISSSDREKMVLPDRPIEESLELIGMKFLSWVGSEEGSRWQRLVMSESERFPELGRLFWDSGPGIGARNLIQYLDAAAKKGFIQISNAEEAANHFLGITLGVFYLRNSFGLPPIVTGDAQTRAWVRGAVAVYLDGYRTKLPTRSSKKRSVDGLSSRKGL